MGSAPRKAKGIGGQLRVCREFVAFGTKWGKMERGKFLKQESSVLIILILLKEQSDLETERGAYEAKYEDELTLLSLFPRQMRHMVIQDMYKIIL